MAGYLNKATLIGNIGRDPEVRNTQDGGKIVTLSVATSESWKDKTTGERKEKTEWHRVVVMNERVADVIERFVRKGSRVYVEGQLQTRKWTDASGQDKYTTEIVIGRFRGELVMLDKLSNDGSSSHHGDDSFTPGEAAGPSFHGAPSSDDDIPF